MAFYLTTYPICRGLIHFRRWRAKRLSNKPVGGICQGTFEIVSLEVLLSARGSYQTIWSSLSRMLHVHDILEDDHMQWHPYLKEITPICDPVTELDLITESDFYQISRGFHRTLATGAPSQQRTVTPPETWSCPTLGLAYVLMLRPIEFWTSLGTSILLSDGLNEQNNQFQTVHLSFTYHQKWHHYKIWETQATRHPDSSPFTCHTSLLKIYGRKQNRFRFLMVLCLLTVMCQSRTIT